jgi:hypothetical protein
VNPLIIEALVDVAAERMDDMIVFFEDCRRDGLLTFEEILNWINEYEPDWKPAYLAELRIAWEMGL